MGSRRSPWGGGDSVKLVIIGFRELGKVNATKEEFFFTAALQSFRLRV